MLEVKEPDNRKQAAPARPRSNGSARRQNVHFATVPTSSVTARSTANGAVPKRRPGDNARLTPSVDRTAAPAPAVKRGLKQVDRLVRQEARLVAAAVICTTVVCTLLVVYLAAYAQVSSLGIQMSKARVELRRQHLLGETLRAQVARAASPDRIAAAAVKNGMVLEHTQQICYVNPTGDVPATFPAGNVAEMPGSGAQQNATGGHAAPPQPQSGTRMASRGTNADTRTTTSVVN